MWWAPKPWGRIKIRCCFPLILQVVSDLELRIIEVQVQYTGLDLRERCSVDSSLMIQDTFGISIGVNDVLIFAGNWTVSRWTPLTGYNLGTPSPFCALCFRLPTCDWTKVTPNYHLETFLASLTSRWDRALHSHPLRILKSEYKCNLWPTFHRTSGLHLWHGLFLIISLMEKEIFSWR